MLFSQALLSFVAVAACAASTAFAAATPAGNAECSKVVYDITPDASNPFQVTVTAHPYACSCLRMRGTCGCSAKNKGCGSRDAKSSSAEGDLCQLEPLAALHYTATLACRCFQNNLGRCTCSPSNANAKSRCGCSLMPEQADHLMAKIVQDVTKTYPYVNPYNAHFHTNAEAEVSDINAPLPRYAEEQRGAALSHALHRLHEKDAQAQIGHAKKGLTLPKVVVGGAAVALGLQALHSYSHMNQKDVEAKGQQIKQFLQSTKEKALGRFSSAASPTATTNEPETVQAN